MVDFVIAVRSYDRATMFVERTWAMLNKQIGMDLKNRLYIFVASDEQKTLYEDALKGKDYNRIVVGPKGGNHINKFMSEYFEVGQNILFLDDDHLGFFEYNDLSGDADPDLGATNMLKYVEDGFKTIEEYGISGFIFRNIQNAFWLKKAHFKEIKPFFFYGGCYGLKNDRNLMTTQFAQCDDCERTAKILEKDGHVLVYNWAGIVFKKGKDYGSNAGGMQSSGDRADGRIDQEVQKLYADTPIIQKYFEEPIYKKEINAFDLTFKRQRYNKNRPVWKTYFEEKTKVL